ncbi:hypothetical protein [Salinarimonas soli]|nr:hypothetical protein [Salinarimonas soli]
MRWTIEDREIVLGSDDDGTVAPTFFSSGPDRWSTKVYGIHHSAR